jgi:hypothetical protein
MVVIEGRFTGQLGIHLRDGWIVIGAIAAERQAVPGQERERHRMHLHALGEQVAGIHSIVVQVNGQLVPGLSRFENERIDRNRHREPSCLGKAHRSRDVGKGGASLGGIEKGQVKFVGPARRYASSGLKRALQVDGRWRIGPDCHVAQKTCNDHDRERENPDATRVYHFGIPLYRFLLLRMHG